MIILQMNKPMEIQYHISYFPSSKQAVQSLDYYEFFNKAHCNDICFKLVIFN